MEEKNDLISNIGSNLASNGNEKLTMGEDQRPSYDDLKKNVDQLINVTHFREFTEYLERLYFDIGSTERFRTFIESEAFGKDMQRRIGDAVGVRDIALCLDSIILVSIDAARTILSHRGFGPSVLPGKLNEEEDIEGIGLCLELLGKCDPILLESVEESDDFDMKKFIQKINNEKDVYKVGHTIERVWREDRTFARKLVESDIFDIAGLAENIKAEDDVEKVNMCLGGIQWASPSVAEKIKAALEMAEDE
jgi:hypothetical protein